MLTNMLKYVKKYVKHLNMFPLGTIDFNEFLQMMTAKMVSFIEYFEPNRGEYDCIVVYKWAYTIHCIGTLSVPL